MSHATIEMLNDLINLCEDAREFYENAARRTHSRGLGESFRRISSTRESVIINLKLHKLSLAGEAAEEDASEGRTSSIFKALKGKLGDEDLVLVENLEKAEVETLDQFWEALNNELPEPTTNLIERQLQILDETSSHMKTLKQRLGNSA